MAFVLTLPAETEDRVARLLATRKLDYVGYRHDAADIEKAREICAKEGLSAANLYLEERRDAERGPKPSKDALVKELIELGLTQLGA